MRILMTGSSGFIGSYLIQEFKKYDIEIFHLIRKDIGYKNQIIWDFDSPLSKNIPQVDVIVHLAAIPYFGQHMNVRQYSVNTVATAKIAKHFESNDCLFIFASMAGIHGKSGYFSTNSPIAPQNHYGMSKYIAENILKVIMDRLIILRIAGVYGLNGPSHLGLNKAINDAYYKGKPPVLYGDGNAKRNYICVLDVVKWIANIIIQTIKGGKNNIDDLKKVMYLAGYEKLKIRDYLEIIAENLTPEKGIVFREGNDSGDCIVESSMPMLKMTSFKEYILTLRKLKIR